MPTKKPAARPKKQLIDLALQGGGSHGAFTWGVLDRLLEEEWLEISGVSGTSAGAMNAVALAAGLMEGGREGARQCLRRFWEQVASSSPFHHLESNPFAALTGMQNPWMQQWVDQWQQAMRLMGNQFSPYQLNPLNLNPLRDILAQTVDFERVRQCHRTHLFIAATHVATGELRVFRQEELTADMVLASACLPLLFQAVEINGEAYWDGGYAGNPTLLPLIAETPADDLLLVQINPTRRERLPKQAEDILERASEVTFNASLLKELRTIGLIKELLKRVESDAKDQRAKDLVELMFESATLRSGYDLRDTAGFADRIETMLRSAMNISPEEQIDEMPEFEEPAEEASESKTTEEPAGEESVDFEKSKDHEEL